MSEVTDKILQLLFTIAPEGAGQEVDPDVDLREQLDIDSMDHLNFLIALSKEFGVEIPEAEYPKLVTLNGCAEYINSKK